MSNDYIEKRNDNCIERMNAILKELPHFVKEFIIGIETYTTPLTRLNYCYDIRIFCDYLCKNKFKELNIDELTLQDLNILKASDIEAFLSYVSSYTLDGTTRHCNERAKARKFSSIRSMFKYFYNREKLDGNVASKVTSPKLHDKEIIRLDDDESEKMMETVRYGDGLSQKQQYYHAKTEKRDIAMVTLLLATGIRVSELVGLNVDDFDLKTHSFVITRKGGNRTVLYYDLNVEHVIFEYMFERKNNDKVSKDEKALFLSLQNTRITTRSVENIIKKYAKLSAPLKKITPHKLRSTFGTNLYKETGDIYMVADFLGHKDINTTRKHYAAIEEDRRKLAVQYIKLPGENKDDRQ